MKKILLFVGICTLLVGCSNPTNTPSSAQRTISTPTYGEGQHTLTEFLDFQCPMCIFAAKEWMPIFEEYAAAGKLKIEYRQYPLTSIHKNAMDDAIAALCAEDQGKYREYAHELYVLEEKKAGASISNTERVEQATALGLDTAAFTQCLE